MKKYLQFCYKYYSSWNTLERQIDAVMMGSHLSIFQCLYIPSAVQINTQKMKGKCEVRNGAQKLNCMPILFALFFFIIWEKGGVFFSALFT